MRNWRRRIYAPLLALVLVLSLLPAVSAAEASGDGPTYLGGKEGNDLIVIDDDCMPLGDTPDEDFDVKRGQYLGFMAGYGDGTMGPERTLTRAEVSQMLYRLMTDEAHAAYDSDKCDYKDVREGIWYYTAVATLTNAGVLDGYEDGTFRPDDNITRAEFVKMIVSIRGIPGDFEVATRYKDISEHWALSYISYAESKEWVSKTTFTPIGDWVGTGRRPFMPEEKLLRAEAAAILNRYLGLEKTLKQLEGLYPRFEDVSPNDWYAVEIARATAKIGNMPPPEDTSAEN